MTLLAQEGGGSLLPLLLLSLTTNAGTGEVLLIHESGQGTAWGYSHLPSTFPLTWSQARSACEAVPGSMLARVDGWQAEAALDEYLKEVHFTDAMWLANRQTLPEVLEDEQRKMNHVDSAGVLGSDLSMGGDVGVTLRCAVYRVGVGLVHELCSEAAVSTALCVQRLSNDRPLLEACPASAHRQWLLVTRYIETSPTPQPQQQTTVTVVGLQQCHHHHRRHLVRASCRPQGSWEHTKCNPEASPTKHHQEVKKTSRGHHHQHERDRPSRGTSFSLTTMNSNSVDYERSLEEKEYLSLSIQQENARHKRSAGPQPTLRVYTTDLVSSYVSSSKTNPTHPPAVKNYGPHINDKVELYITNYKRSKSSYEKQFQVGIQPDHTISRPQTLTEKIESQTLPSRLTDTDLKKTETYNVMTILDPVVNETETESDLTIETGQPSVLYRSTTETLKINDSAIYYEHKQENTKLITTPAQEENNPREDQGTEEVQDEAARIARKDIIVVSSGPVFVHGPEAHNEANREDPLTLVFTKDSTLTDPGDSLRPDNDTEPANITAESSISGKEKDALPEAVTTSPRRPVVFPRTEGGHPYPEKAANVTTPHTQVANTDVKIKAHTTKETTLSATDADEFLEVYNSGHESDAASTSLVNVVESEERGDQGKRIYIEERKTPAFSDLPKRFEAANTTTESTTAGKTQRRPDIGNTENSTSISGERNGGKVGHEAQEGSKNPNLETLRSDASTPSPITPNTRVVSEHQKQVLSASSPSNTSSRVTTERPRVHGTKLLITQIFKSIFG